MPVGKKTALAAKRGDLPRDPKQLRNAGGHPTTPEEIANAKKSSEKAKVSSPATDTLDAKVSTLVKQHGPVLVLQALAKVIEALPERKEPHARK